MEAESTERPLVPRPVERKRLGHSPVRRVIITTTTIRYYGIYPNPEGGVLLVASSGLPELLAVAPALHGYGSLRALCGDWEARLRWDRHILQLHAAAASPSLGSVPLSTDLVDCEGARIS